jgi:S-(hydroxymethyl)glutathione dehydrogenase/alcohol dehydrogenase
VLQALRIADARPVVAVDVNPDKEELARRCGADVFLAVGPDTAKRVRASTGGYGVDQAFECAGSGAAVRLAWSCTRRGGSTTVVGIGSKDDEVRFGALELFHFARSLRGCVFGNSDPDRDLPDLADHVRAGRLRPADLVTDRIGLAAVPAAFDRMRVGAGGRSLVVFD